jgi:hypothetical protein
LYWSALRNPPVFDDGVLTPQFLHAYSSSAEARYRLALVLDPDSPNTHYQYGVLLNGVGRKEEARGHFAAACRAGVARACDALKSGR